MAKTQFTNEGARLADLAQAAVDRQVDARALFEAGRHASAIAMGMYAVEIALKVKICHRLDVDRLPRPFEVHDLDGLLLLSGLKKRLDAADPRVNLNWEKLTPYKDQYVNELRYMPGSPWERSHANVVLNALEEAPYGVLAWLDSQGLSAQPSAFVTHTGATPTLGAG